MPSFEDMQKIYQNVGSHGQQLKIMADDVMQQTWNFDIQTRRCYLYDYYHDNNKDKCTGYDPSLDKDKIPVDLKFIVKSYKSVAKEDPEYHIQFSPDDWNNRTYYRDWFEDYKTVGCTEMLGCYLDIPDDRGVYYKWLIVYSEVANQFPKFGVLKCNYHFQWVEDNGIERIKRQMWGVERAQKSYTSQHVNRPIYLHIAARYIWKRI